MELTRQGRLLWYPGYVLGVETVARQQQEIKTQTQMGVLTNQLFGF
jgi:hypothetical protein